MAGRNGATGEPDEAEGDVFDPQEYDELLQLERLESLEEEMMELGVTSLDEIRERIAHLHQQMDSDDE
jgi:hypothetical protein